MFKNGMIGTWNLLISLIYTKFRFPNARIIRIPFDIRNRKYIKIGDHFTSGVGNRLEAYPIENNIVLTIGNNVQMNDYVHITASKSVIIGDNVLMASKIYISDTIHGSYLGDENDSDPNTPPNDRPNSYKKVHIEKNVWIGEFVSILPGVTIGCGSIIGANSVVSKDIPAFTIAAGIPAKPIKKFNFAIQKWEKI
jgi:acetyltransferase-like isoleucine patch superfamily enzyme